MANEHQPCKKPRSSPRDNEVLLDFHKLGWASTEFRCMVQDILGNEIAKMGDSMVDRTVYYGISIPGENEWVKNASKSSVMPGDSDANNSQITDDVSRMIIKSCFPLGDNPKNRSCLIKVYDFEQADKLRVNDVLHVVGFIEPFVADQEHRDIAGGDGLPDDEYDPINDMPYKLVPRVHVKNLIRMNHLNPMFSNLINRDSVDLTKIKLARARLSTILAQLFGGDELAAEYLIISLISRIHRRKDVQTVGQLSLGFQGVKADMKFLIDKIYDVISKITTHSHMIDLTIENLNRLKFSPEKDYANNKMISGSLQLPDGLCLVLNETALSEGQLSSQGLTNLTTLGNIIKWQTHKYHFQFSEVIIDTDLKILVFSDGKSLLKLPYIVRLENDEDTVSSMRRACESVDDFLTADLLNMFRYYITALRDVPEYNIPDRVGELVQENFVSWRKRDEAQGKSMFSAADLSSYMTVARYLTLSRAETTLTEDIWRETYKLEEARQARLR